MFIADGIRALIHQPLIGIALLLFLVFMGSERGKRSLGFTIIRQVRGFAYLIIFGVGACGALLLRQPLVMLGCIGLALYGIYEMRPHEGPRSSGTAPAKNEADSARLESRALSCCPHCAADVKNIGEPGRCWLCGKPLPPPDSKPV